MTQYWYLATAKLAGCYQKVLLHKSRHFQSKSMIFMPPLKKGAYCFATVGRYVGRSVYLSVPVFRPSVVRSISFDIHIHVSITGICHLNFHYQTNLFWFKKLYPGLMSHLKIIVSLRAQHKFWISFLLEWGYVFAHSLKWSFVFMGFIRHIIYGSENIILIL